MSESIKTVICDFCNKSFSRKDSCNRHQKLCKDKDMKKKLKEKDNELLKKDEEINFLKTLLIANKSQTTIINNNYTNNGTIINNTISIRDMVDKLDPIDFKDIRNHMDKFSGCYIDEGVKGFAKFLCEVPCKDKFITTDFARSTIAYKTKDIKFIRDPEASYLMNTSVKENKEEIIDKATARASYINKRIREAEDDEEREEYIVKKDDIHSLKDSAENINTVKIIDKDASNIFKISGLDKCTMLENKE